MAKKKDPNDILPPRNPIVEGEPSVLLEYNEDGSMVTVVELHDPKDTREEDAEKLDTLQEIEYHEQFPPKRTSPKGYAAPRFDAKQQRRFLNRLANTGLLTMSCAWTPVTRKTVLEWRKKSKAFAALYDQALDQYRDKLESELMRRAVQGVKRPIFQKGHLVGHERVYSDRLLELTMKKHDPAYKDKLDVSANVTGGVLVVAPMAENQAEWEKRYGKLRTPDCDNGRNHQEEPAQPTNDGPVHVIKRV